MLFTILFKESKNYSIIGHGNWIMGTAYSPDGKHFATCSNDRTVILHDALKFEIKATLNGHTAYATCVQFSHDSKTLLSGGQDKTIRFWLVADGSFIRSLTFAQPVSSLAISPCSTFVIVTSDGGRISAFDINSGTQLKALTRHSAAVQSVVFTSSLKSSTSSTIQAINWPPLIL